jgi:PBSX family phage terminase large subunit
MTYQDQLTIKTSDYYKPTAKQKLFHGANQIYKLYGGAMGGGKSRALCEEVLALSLEYPNNFIVVARQTLPELKSTTLLSWQEEVINGDRGRLIANYNKSENLYTLKNNSKILFTGLDSDNIDRLKSMNLGSFAIDEATEVADDIFLMFCTRLRRKGCRYFGLLASNPEPGWVKEKFVNEAIETQPGVFIKGDNFTFIKSLPNENPYLPETYIDRFKDFPDDWRKRYLEGSWEVFELQIFKEYSSNIHLIPFFDAIYEGEKQRSIDYGERNPTACLWASFLENKFDQQLDCFIYREFYLPGIVQDTGRVIKNWSKDERYTTTYLDPMAKNRRGSTGVNIQEEFKDVLGVTPTPGTVSDNAKREAIHRWLKIDKEHCHPTTGIKGAPHLFICDNLTYLPKELIEFKWLKPSVKQLSLNLPEEAEDKNNHAIDALGWLLAGRPQVKGSVVMTKKEYQRDQWNKLEQSLTGLDDE